MTYLGAEGGNRGAHVPVAFRRDAINYGDLPVTDLAPALVQELSLLGFSQVAPEELPEIELFGQSDRRKHFKVKTVEELPEWAKYDGLKMPMAEYMGEIMTTPKKYVRAHRRPEPKLYFMRKAQEETEKYTILAVRSGGPLATFYLEQELDFEVNSVARIETDLTSEMAGSLLVPNAVRRQFTENNGRMHVLNRGTEYQDDEQDRSPFAWLDNHFCYSLNLLFHREGEYPISDQRKPEVAQSFAELLAKTVKYELEYRKKMLELFDFGIKNNLPINELFAAREK